MLHQIIVRVYKIWDVNLEQNFTQYTKNLVKIAKKEAAKETENIAEDKATATKMRAGIYLLSTFNVIFVGIMHSIIALFVTDG